VWHVIVAFPALGRPRGVPTGCMSAFPSAVTDERRMSHPPTSVDATEGRRRSEPPRGSGHRSEQEYSAPLMFPWVSSLHGDSVRAAALFTDPRQPNRPQQLAMKTVSFRACRGASRVGDRCASAGDRPPSSCSRLARRTEFFKGFPGGRWRTTRAWSTASQPVTPQHRRDPQPAQRGTSHRCRARLGDRWHCRLQQPKKTQARTCRCTPARQSPINRHVTPRDPHLRHKRPRTSPPVPLRVRTPGRRGERRRQASRGRRRPTGRRRRPGSPRGERPSSCRG
jgi:hypothetical protein